MIKRDVGTKGCLNDLMEPQFLDGGHHLRDATEAALADDGRRNDGIDPVFRIVLRFLQNVDDVEHQRLVGNGTEGAFIDTGTAGDALLVVDFGFLVLVDGDGLHLATHHTRAVLQDDGGVGAGLGAFAALDALVLIDGGAVVHDGNSVFGAHFLATVYHTATAGGRDIDAVNRTFVAGTVDDLDDVGVALVAAHRHLDAVLQNGAFLVDAAARFGFRAGA